jgi:integral membrane protein (TIGR01906 family)
VSERLVVGAATLAIALVVPAILLADGLRLVTGDWYVRAVYEHGGVPKDDLGLTARQRTALAITGLHAIRPDEKDGLQLLRRARLPSSAPAFSAREVRHMSDVRTLLGRLYTLQVAGAIAIAVLALALGLRPSRRRLVPRALRLGALVSLGLAAYAGVAAVLYWPAFSTPFHLLFFGESSWRFDDADTLRRLYPDRFWIDTAIFLGLLAVLQAAALWALARAWERRAQGRKALVPKTAA